MPSSSLQVVPDIEDTPTTSSANTTEDVEVVPGSSHFESALREAALVGSDAMPCTPTPTHNRVQRFVLHNDSFAPVIPIVHVGWDARPLTSAEVIAHCHLFAPQSRVA